MPAHKVIIDTDPGVDDAMAILFACLHEEIDLLGLTTVFGNVTIDMATRNALALLEVAGLDAPVAEGAAQPLVQPPRPPATDIHGPEGLGDEPRQTPQTRADPRSAARFICDMADRYPGEIALCPVGPLTNLALAMDLDSDICAKVKSVTVMGGSIWEGGNATPHAEANFWQDPHAAEKVLAAPWDITLVGLDVTHRIIGSPDDFAGLADVSPRIGGFLNRVVPFYMRFHDANDGFYGSYMHDPSAVISILHPELFTMEPHPVTVAVEGEEIGRSLITRSGNRPAVNVCAAVDQAAVMNVFRETIARGA
ncbi:MAG: nucleoside hydrolase [Pseudomonadota bacterium]